MSSVLMWCGEDRQRTVAWLTIHAVTGDGKTGLDAAYRRHRVTNRPCLIHLVPIWALGVHIVVGLGGADLACLPS